MAINTLEERVALLERELLTLKRQLLGTVAVPWWEQISDVFADVPGFDAATELGRRYRESQRPAADEDAGVPA